MTDRSRRPTHGRGRDDVELLPTLPPGKPWEGDERRQVRALRKLLRQLVRDGAGCTICGRHPPTAGGGYIVDGPDFSDVLCSVYGYLLCDGCRRLRHWQDGVTAKLREHIEVCRGA